MASHPITAWQIEGEKVEVVTDFPFFGSKITTDGDCTHEIRRWLLLGRNVEKQRHYSANKGLYSQNNGFPSGHVQLWELGHKEGRMPKNWCIWSVVLEKALESPLDSKEIRPINLKGNQSWILIGRTDAEVGIPVFCSSYANSWLIGEVPDAGKDWEAYWVQHFHSIIF